MKFISWNVNGIRACAGKGFMDFFQETDADIFCIQETKMQEGQLELDTPGYHQYWNYAKKKGYSGTAIFTKQEPISVSYGLGIEEHDRVYTKLPERACKTGLSYEMGGRFSYILEKAGRDKAGYFLR